MEKSHAINLTIQKYLNDTSKPIDGIWYNATLEEHIKSIKEKAIKYIIELAGRPYLYIHKIFIDLILEWNARKMAQNFNECPLNLFHFGEIYELPTKEVCEFIKQSYDKIDANMIYIHGSSTGLEEHALIQSGVFNTIPDIKSFDKATKKKAPAKTPAKTTKKAVKKNTKPKAVSNPKEKEVTPEVKEQVENTGTMLNEAPIANLPH